MAESDWDTVTVLRKKGPTAAQAKSKQVSLFFCSYLLLKHTLSYTIEPLIEPQITVKQLVYKNMTRNYHVLQRGSKQTWHVLRGFSISFSFNNNNSVSFSAPLIALKWLLSYKVAYDLY